MNWSVAADVAQAVAALAVAFAAVYGVNAWKREHIGKRRLELAEDVLTSFYEARDAIGRIRRPWSFRGEGASRKRQEGESSEEAELLDQAYVVFERYEKERQVFNRLYAMRFKMMAQFSAAAEKPFSDLQAVVNNVFYSAQRLGAHYWPRQGRVPMSDEEHQKHVQEMHEHETVFWARRAMENDPVAVEVNRIIADIERICRPGA